MKKQNLIFILYKKEIELGGFDHDQSALSLSLYQRLNFLSHIFISQISYIIF